MKELELKYKSGEIETIPLNDVISKKTLSLTPKIYKTATIKDVIDPVVLIKPRRPGFKVKRKMNDFWFWLLHDFFYLEYDNIFDLKESYQDCKNGKLELIGFMLQYLHKRYNEEGMKFKSIDFDIAFLAVDRVYEIIREDILKIDKESE